MGLSPIYLDHAATTDVLEPVVSAVSAQMLAGANPSSLHAQGRKARAQVEEAREMLAQAIGCDPAEIIFTSGGTEADNLAVKGLWWKQQAADPARKRILVSAVEHHAVTDAVEWLVSRQGASVDWIPVDRQGVVKLGRLQELIEQNPQDVALLALMWANNEVGAIQPVAEAAQLAARYGIPVHTDAVQAFGAIPINFAQSGVSSMAISAHKMGGPMGIGALLATRHTALEPLLHGGGQERSVRSGTINAAAIVGFGVAAQWSSQNVEQESRRIGQLRNRLIQAVQAEIPGAHLQGPAPETDLQLMQEGPQRRLPNNAHFTFTGCEGDSLLFLLDRAGVASSTGSACNAGVPRPSQVLLAMGLDEAEARGAQRFTLGHTTKAADIDYLLEVLPAAYQQAYRAGLAARNPDSSTWH